LSVLQSNRLRGKKVGIVFGTFAPMHLGHYHNIVRAKRENDACIVIVSGYKGDRGDEIGLDVLKRFRYTRELFKDDDNVYVDMIDETDVPRYPNGWREWLKMAYKIYSDATHEEMIRTWYVGEEDYKKELEDRTMDNVVLLDRNILNISATDIRDNPLKHWNYITRPFRRHFSFNILVTGSASNGKTTLVRDLARTLGSPFTDEYARRYEEESNVRDEELVANDFHYLASGQFKNNKEAIMSPANNGIFIADTDVLTTKCYSKVYLSKEEHEKLVPMYDLMASKQKWDLILFIPPTTEYVDDGFRDMSHADDNFRWKMTDMMLQELKDNGLSSKIKIVESEKTTCDENGHYDKFEKSLNIIKNEILKKYGITI